MGNMIGPNLSEFSIEEATAVMVCPYCERGEEFDSLPAARAWLHEHIRRAHDNELPAYES